MRWYFITIMSVCIVWPTLAETESIPDCAELLRNRCQSCHYLERVCSQVGEKPNRRWKTILKRMVKVHGAEVSAEEQEFLLHCLSTPAPDIKKECEK